jgi:crotonobetainyl-CoA:carnitine CoA-transferase CaiB-like acyl-CoA transferase
MSGNSALGEEATATGPLAGVRILDLTTVIMGPASTQILGDLGADVIKIENPGGDSMRYIGPAHHESMGPLYLQSNRNKRSVVLDLKSKEGREALLSLVPDADIVVYNVRPQAMKRLGIDYETLSAINPKIIFCGAVGYGSDGPNSGQAVYDDLMQAASGISGLFHAVDGAPRYAPVNICDRVVGLTSALYNRSVTGKGQQIEVPMFETMAQFVVADHMGGRAFEPNIGPMGYKRLLSRVRGPYQTKDGYVSLVVYLDKHWHAFCELVGDPGMIERDPLFATQELRTQNAELAGQYLAKHLPTRTNAEWIEFCRTIDIPIASVNSIDDLFDDPHLKAVGMFEQAQHPTEGVINYARFPIKFSATPASIRRLAPNLGEHTEEVLGSVPARNIAAN